jgi:hypothetical protein
MAFLSCLPLTSAPPLDSSPIDAGLLPSAFYLLCGGALHKRARAARECSHAVLYLFLFLVQFLFLSPFLSTHFPSSLQPTPLFSATSALTTRPLLAEARMLTALSIQQYSFSTFTTLLYRPPCGGIALDVYNYS